MLKLLSLVLLPIPLLLWPVAVAIGSLLAGVGYGFGQPLVATFEAVGESRDAKLFHSLTVWFRFSPFDISYDVTVCLRVHHNSFGLCRDWC